MDSLRIALMIIGLLVILALLGKGLWTIRKNNQQARGEQETLERKRSRQADDLFSAADDIDLSEDTSRPPRDVSTRPGRSRKREPEIATDVETDLLHDEQLHEPDLQQMEIDLNDERASVEQQQMGLLDDDNELVDDSAGAEQSPRATTDQAQQVKNDQHSPLEEPAEAEEEPQAEPAAKDDMEVITLFITGDIQGAILLQMTAELGLKYGEMDIFHRHLESSGHGPVLFSVANMFNPGTFDIHSMERFHTEGLVLFMTLPLKSDGHQAFTMMYNAANKIADAMPRAAVLDGNRNPVTKQSVQHTYQRIREFERKQRLQKPTTNW
ncbi:cell division protein ZipA [Aliidiomarina soli]|uniref:Cell division protein ZipA n=1 Tax=Aliidiomarina soli TaxID=1928574 RepID=A0A432WH39_9GAMM|nr:cell division protein ZipA [Aliidiomarina soli]RUO33120.1 cell division protein ZipA [Aliidiomarina soli]